MHRLPWAKFTTRVTPKITVSPADTRNSDDADASPVSSVAAKSMGQAGRSFATSASDGITDAPSTYTASCMTGRPAASVPTNAPIVDC